MSWGVPFHLPEGRGRSHHPGMLTLDDVAEAEWEALLAYEEAGLDPEFPLPVGETCKALFGRPPRPIPGLPREASMAILNNEVEIYYRASMWHGRARFACAHEMGHGRLRRHHGTGGLLLEAKADLLGACLLAPRPAFLRMVKKLGHSVYDLAHAFDTTHATALLRLGEVTGRPVRLLGQRERVRGEPFVWPDVRKCLAGRCRNVVHPIKLADEKKVGLMAVG